MGDFEKNKDFGSKGKELLNKKSLLLKEFVCFFILRKTYIFWRRGAGGGVDILTIPMMLEKKQKDSSPPNKVIIKRILYLNYIIYFCNYLLY